MMPSSFLFIILLFIPISLICGSQTKRVQDQMYVSFDRIRYCVRRLNGTHQIGCQSEINGNSGHMYMIDNQTEFDSYLSDSKIIDSSPSFIIFLNINLFNGYSIDRLMQRLDSKLNGLLLYYKSNETRPKDFSSDDQCPNHRQSFYLNQTTINWNPQGSGLFFRSFPFPIMLIDEKDDYERLVQFYQQFRLSSSAPSCGLELKVFQNAAHTSKTCMRRNDISHSLIDLQETFCDPVGGLNIYSKLPQSIRVQPNPRPAKSVVLILARTDAFQMFLKTKVSTGGVQQPATALIAFLALAHLIGQQQEQWNKQEKELIFITLDGDALDYSASYKFMFDMIHDYFPMGNSAEQRIRPEHVHSIIELQALNMDENYSLFTSPSSKGNQSFIDTIVRLNPKIKPVPSDSPLPPASSQIFLRQTSSLFPAYVFTSASQSQLNNHYYHSFFDDPSTVGLDLNQTEYNTTTTYSQKIKNFVEPLAQALLENFVGDSAKSVTIEQDIVNNLVYCVLKNINCPLIHNITNQSVGNTFDSSELTAMPFSINTYPTSSTPTFPFVKYVLGYFLRDRSYDGRNLSDSQCQDLASNDSFSSFNYVGGYGVSIDGGRNYSSYCVRSYVRTSQSASPAFSIENYDLSQTTYPAWTESRWSTVSLRLFIIPTRTHEIVTLVVGILLLVISFVVLCLLRIYTNLSLLQPSSS